MKRWVLAPNDKIHVLIAGSPPRLAKALHDILLQRNMHIYTMAKVDSSIAAIQLYPIDVVLLDLVIGCGKAIETIKKIKCTYPKVEILLLTDCDSVAEALKGMKAGAFLYLVKPPEIETLVEKIREAFLAREKAIKDTPKH